MHQNGDAWLTVCNTSGTWGSGHTGPARLRTRSAIAMIASGRIGHACTARGDGGDTAIATDTALASHCYHVLPRLHRGTALVQVRPAKAERTANTTVHQWQRFRSIAVATCNIACRCSSALDVSCQQILAPRARFEAAEGSERPQPTPSGPLMRLISPLASSAYALSAHRCVDPLG